MTIFFSQLQLANNFFYEKGNPPDKKIMVRPLSTIDSNQIAKGWTCNSDVYQLDSSGISKALWIAIGEWKTNMQKSINCWSVIITDHIHFVLVEIISSNLGTTGKCLKRIQSSMNQNEPK